MNWGTKLVLGMVTVIGMTIGLVVVLFELVVVDLLQAIKIEKINGSRKEEKRSRKESINICYRLRVGSVAFLQYKI